MTARAGLPGRSSRQPATRASVVLVAGLLGLLGGCGPSSPDGSGSGVDCSVAGQNAQLLAILQSWYYWYASLPANVDPASYPSADALLDAVRQQPLDRFSYFTTQEADRAFYGAGQYVGFGFGFRLSASSQMEITRVFPGSPADQAGLLRGATVTELNGIPVPSLVANGQLERVLSVSEPGVAVTFSFIDRQGQSRTASIVSAVVTQPSVGVTRVIELGAERVGYLQFDSFIDTSTALLDQAFARFLGEGVTQLVIDERYNGGGKLSVAQHLASLIVGNAYAGRALARLTFNDKHQDQNQTVPFASVTSPLDLAEVFFITSDATASASELTINGLVPYVRVVTVGSTTFGKPVGANAFNVCANVLYPITFKAENSTGFGDFFDGLAPTCAAFDDLTHPLGDPDEGSLATALHYVSRGDCGPGTAAAAAAQAARDALRPRRATRYGWRQLINAY